MINKLFDSLTKDSIILTGNNRLSVWLCERYADYQQSKNITIYQKPLILPIKTWIIDLWETAKIRGLTKNLSLISDHQAEWIFEQIIQKDDNTELVNLSHTAKDAFKAWQLLHQWRIPFDDALLTLTLDSQRFLIWAKTFESIYQEKSFIDFSQLPKHLETLLSQIKMPKEIICMGFIDKQPAIESLLKHCKNSDISIVDHRLTLDKNTVKRLEISDVRTEIETMARFAKQQLINGKKNISCIVPSLDEHRDQIEAIFTDVFEDFEKFNISSGTPLSDEPIIHAALSLLSLSKNELSISDISELLHSPFIKDSQKEMTHYALLDATLRSKGNVSYTLKQLLDDISKDEFPAIRSALSALSNLVTPSLQTFSFWLEIFLQRLSFFGWHGDRTINSKEYQAIEQFKASFKELKRFDMIGEKISYQDALRQLKNLCSQTLFQIKKSQSPIQILGMLESTGLLFDSAWIMGLDNEHWPTKPNPNPYLPLFLQRQNDMPHSSPHRELIFAQQMTDHFLHCAKKIIISYPKQDHERIYEPSTLISSIEKIDIGDLTLAEYLSTEKKLFHQKELESLIDKNAPPVIDETIHGGTSILKEQALCPFKAFASIRLHAASIDEPQSGITAIEKGNITHKALELFFKKIDSQKKLLALSHDECEEKISCYINQAIQSTLTNRAIPIALIEIERTRQKEIFQQWIAIEKSRQPFEIIAQEDKQRITLGKTTLSVRVDRIDKIGEESYAVIDYKTGKTDKKKWEGDRPEEPQLPLYAAYSEHPIKAIAFAQLACDEIGFKGISEKDDLLPGVKMFEENPFEEWKKTLEKLMDDFNQGIAITDPKDNTACRYCHLKTLCRMRIED